MSLQCSSWAALLAPLLVDSVCVCVFVCKGGCEQLSELVAVHVQSGCHSTLLRSYMLD